MADIFDELVNILANEDVKIKFSRENVATDVNRDFEFRILIILLTLFHNKKTDNYSMNVNLLKLTQFIIVNKSYEKNLIEFVARNKMSKNVVGDAFLLSNDYKFDSLFDELLRYIYISEWIVWKDAKSIQLTPAGIKMVMDCEKIINEKTLFQEVLTSIDLIKKLKLTNKMIEA